MQLGLPAQTSDETNRFDLTSLPHLTQARFRHFESPLDPHAGCPGRYINVWRCGRLSMVILQLKKPLQLFVKRREFLPGSGFLSRRNVT